jgi:hypothetical protein
MVRNRENPKVRKTAETEKRPKSPKNGPKNFVTVRNSHPSSLNHVLYHGTCKVPVRAVLGIQVLSKC